MRKLYKYHKLKGSNKQKEKREKLNKLKDDISLKVNEFQKKNKN